MATVTNYIPYLGAMTCSSCSPGWVPDLQRSPHALLPPGPPGLQRPGSLPADADDPRQALKLNPVVTFWPFPSSADVGIAGAVMAVPISWWYSRSSATKRAAGAHRRVPGHLERATSPRLRPSAPCPAAPSWWGGRLPGPARRGGRIMSRFNGSASGPAGSDLVAGCGLHLRNWLSRSSLTTRTRIQSPCTPRSVARDEGSMRLRRLSVTGPVKSTAWVAWVRVLKHAGHVQPLVEAVGHDESLSPFCSLFSRVPLPSCASAEEFEALVEHALKVCPRSSRAAGERRGLVRRKPDPRIWRLSRWDRTRSCSPLSGSSLGGPGLLLSGRPADRVIIYRGPILPLLRRPPPGDPRGPGHGRPRARASLRAERGRHALLVQGEQSPVRRSASASSISSWPRPRGRGVGAPLQVGAWPG